MRTRFGLVVALVLGLSGVSVPASAESEGKAQIGIGKSTNRNFVLNRRPSKKNGRFTPATESRKWRKGYGAYGGRGKRQAADLQKGANGKVETGASVGRTWETDGVLKGERELKDDALAGCGGKYKVLSAGAGLEAGVRKGDGKSKIKNLSCNAGVEGALAKGSFDCVKVMAGDRDNGVLVRGGGEGFGGGTLGCKCEDGGVICEAFVGIKGGLNGGVGGVLCGVGLTVNGGVEGGAGAGGAAQVGYVKGKGYGLAVAGYIGLGVGGKVYVDPKLDKILDKKTWACLGDKLKDAGGTLASGVRNAWNRLGSLFGGQDGGGGSAAARTLTR